MFKIVKKKPLKLYKRFVVSSQKVAFLLVTTQQNRALETVTKGINCIGIHCSSHINGLAVVLHAEMS